MPKLSWYHLVGRNGSLLPPAQLGNWKVKEALPSVSLGPWDLPPALLCLCSPLSSVFQEGRHTWQKKLERPGNPTGRQGYSQSSREKRQKERLLKVSRGDQLGDKQVLMGASSKVCVRRKQEKREAGFSLGRRGRGRPEPSSAAVDEGERACGQ